MGVAVIAILVALTAVLIVGRFRSQQRAYQRDDERRDRRQQEQLRRFERDSLELDNLAQRKLDPPTAP